MSRHGKPFPNFRSRKELVETLNDKFVEALLIEVKYEITIVDVGNEKVLFGVLASEYKKIQ